MTWDAPIHSVDDIAGAGVAAADDQHEAVALRPAAAELFATYDHLAANGIGAYGGGQTELGPGRGQIQYLASLFHPDTPNDIAPSGYNEPAPPDDLPAEPPAGGRRTDRIPLGGVTRRRASRA